VQEGDTLDIYTTESLTEQDKVKEGTTLFIFGIEEDKTENKLEAVLIRCFNSPICQGYHYAFWITQEEFGFLVEDNRTTLTTTKKTLVLIQNFLLVFYEDKDIYAGYPWYVLFTPFFLTSESPDRSQDSLLGDKTTSFKLNKYQTNIACCTLCNIHTSEHYQNWLNQQFWTGAEIIG
jgi:hypothetical protein